MKTLFLAIPRNEPRHQPRVALIGVNLAIAGDSAKIRVVGTIFGFELSIALKQLIE